MWVDSYRKKYRIGLPDTTDSVDLPKDKQKVIDSLKGKTGTTGGCWDLFLWRDNQILFVELKRLKKDKIQNSQIKWLGVALESNFSTRNFALVEWGIKADISFEYPEDKQFFIDLLANGNEKQFNKNF